VVSDKKGHAWAKYIGAMKETIHVYPDKKNELRADHVLKFFGLVFLRLHYRMTSQVNRLNAITSTITAKATHS